MSAFDYITVQDLYAYAKLHNLLDARIRISDGMAVSYYPDMDSLCRGRYEVHIDVSALEPVEYDELDAWAQRQYDTHRECESLARTARSTRRTATPPACEADKRGPSQKITPDTPANELPWEIYGYGRRKK